MYGLGAGGATGLSDILDLISNEASSVMGLIGKKSVTDVGKANLATTHTDQAFGRS
jgi:isopentenyl diphosphate isomerase/L-lactate dehydrogenase-like FMN-dependent dehydrogenase